MSSRCSFSLQVLSIQRCRSKHDELLCLSGHSKQFLAANDCRIWLKTCLSYCRPVLCTIAAIYLAWYSPDTRLFLWPLRLQWIRLLCRSILPLHQFASVSHAYGYVSQVLMAHASIYHEHNPAGYDTGPDASSRKMHMHVAFYTLVWLFVPDWNYL